MSPSQPQFGAQQRIHTSATDAAASAFLWKTYSWMAGGLALTGLVAAVTVRTPALVAICN